MPLHGHGRVPAKILILGAEPGYREMSRGEVFTGPVGIETRRLIEHCGLRWDELFLTNIRREPSDEHDTEFNERLTLAGIEKLREELARVRPSHIITLGIEAARLFLGEDITIDEVWGLHLLPEPCAFTRFPELRHDVTIFPQTHPAAGFHSPEASSQTLVGFEKLRLALKRGLYARALYGDPIPAPTYRELHTAEDVRHWMFGVTALATDTEGYNHRPWSVQLTSAAGEGVLIRANNEPALEELRFWWRECKPRTTMHAGLHDLSVLRQMGIDLIDWGVELADTQLNAYLLGVVPQGLKALALRELGMPMLSYAEVLGDAQDRHARTYLEWLWDEEDTEWQALRQEDFEFQTRIAKRRIKKIPDLPKSRFHKAIERVLRAKAPARLWTDQVLDIRVEAEKRIGPMPEASLSDVEYPVALRYAGRDPDATYRLEKVQQPQLEDMGLLNVQQLDLSTYPILDRMMRVGITPDTAAFTELAGVLETELARLRAALATATGKPAFNANSGDQVADYLFGALGLETVGRMTDSGRESTNDKVLEALERMYPEHTAIADIRSYREYYKLLHTFVNVLPALTRRWPHDGRIHCELMLTRTPSGRLCVAQGTPVETVRDVRAEPQGTPIEQVKPGMLVYTYDAQRELTIRRVLWSGKTGTKRVVRIHWRGAGNHHTGHLDVTPDHPVRLVSGAYKDAGLLEPGDRILALSQGTKNHTVVCVESLPEPVDVYDIEVEDTHNFIAGELCIHNSAKNPNLLAMPKHGKFAKAFRRCFVPGAGRLFLSADESQVELRVGAHLSQDPVMLAIYRGEMRNPDGSFIDLHTNMCKRILGRPEKNSGERTAAKAVNFGYWMGQTAIGLALELRKAGLDIDEDDAQRWIDEANALYVGAVEYKARMIAEAETNGYVRCMSGRIRYIGGIRSRNERVRAEAERFAYSTPVQEGAQFIGKRALARAWHEVYVPYQRAGRYVEPVMWTHDDLLSEVEDALVPEVAAQLKAILEDAPPGFSVPLATEPEAGVNWCDSVEV